MSKKDIALENDLSLETGLVPLDSDELKTAVYEIGYHLVPTLSEEELPVAVSKITDTLKGEGAIFVGEQFPSRIQLAYSIAKRIDTVRKNFDEAYFGWMAFEISKKALTKIKAALDVHPSLLRYLFIVTDKNAVAVTLGGKSASIHTITPTGDIGKPKRAVEEGGEVSEVALEQALQSIATEDAKVSEDVRPEDSVPREGVGKREESAV